MRTSPSIVRSLSSAVAALALAAACKSEPAARPFAVRYVEPAPPARAQEPLAGPDVVGRADGNLARFCKTLTAKLDPGLTVGVLPFAYRAGERVPATVPEYGVELATEFAAALAGHPYKGVVLAPTEMAMTLADMHVDAATLTTLEDVRRNGELLNVDVVVFGMLKRVELGRMHYELAVDVQAFSLADRRAVAGEKYHAKGFDWGSCERASVWIAEGDFAPATEIDFEGTLEFVDVLLARRIALALGAEGLPSRGYVYVAPCDVSQYVRSLSALRSTQRAYLAELARRETALAAGGGDPLAQPCTLDGLEFPDMAAAGEFIARFQESVLDGKAGHLSKRISGDLASQLAGLFRGASVRQELSFVRGADAAALEADVSVGGLANNRKTQNRLREEEIALVVAPRLEQLGENFRVRVELYDLVRGTYLSAPHARIDQRFSGDLARELDIRDERGEIASKLVRAAPAAASPSAQGWQTAYARVTSGVCQLVCIDRKTGGGSTGTGFLVAPNLLMTNSHVVEPMRTAPERLALFDGGERIELGADWLAHDDKFWDIALVRLPRTPSGAHVFEFADPARAAVGVEIAVIGFPRGADGKTLGPGFLTSITESCDVGHGARPSFLYSCPTRCGTSGGPAIGFDGRVLAVNSAGMLGVVGSSGGAQVRDASGGMLTTELPGFGLGCPGKEARRILESAVGARR